jgi:hypothetical protein
MAESTRTDRVVPLDPQAVKGKRELSRKAELEGAHERAKASAGEVSPHYGGRAQPGDVLGIETGGETTGIGDTAEDENARRRAAEEDAPEE